ncbi:transcriptional regulator, tetr family [hydrocarbon metagenome]|uniref:Transcriptional regulator, tetr family n=1 Tax=hydrocarbon metagenome TaxID=938273 RepID=A0A0W8FR61_9ZZZZ
MPKIVNHDEYRQELLKKSLRLFTRKGYHNINMKEIAAENDVSTGSLYHYFPSKENMLAQMIAWLGDENVDEYIRRTSSIESVRERFDMIIDYWKENRELYQNIMLLAIDVFRNVDMKQWKEVYTFFAERYTAGMSERLNISRQLAKSIFIHFLGLSFHSLAFDEPDEYDQQIDFLNTILRPPIVDAPNDLEKAAQKLKKITRTVLMNPLAPEKTTIEKRKIQHKIKMTKNKKITGPRKKSRV